MALLFITFVSHLLRAFSGIVSIVADGLSIAQWTYLAENSLVPRRMHEVPELRRFLTNPNSISLISLLSALLVGQVV
jgi:hypothetical protein